MHEHKDFLRRRHNITVLLEYAHRVANVDRAAAETQVHVDCERVSSPEKVVTTHAVHRGSVSVSCGRGFALGQQCRHRRETDIYGPTDKANASSNIAINQTRNATRTIGRRSTHWSWVLLYCAVHFLDDVGGRFRRVDNHARSATDIRYL